MGRKTKKWCSGRKKQTEDKEKEGLLVFSHHKSHIIVKRHLIVETHKTSLPDVFDGAEKNILQNIQSVPTANQVLWWERDNEKCGRASSFSCEGNNKFKICRNTESRLPLLYSHDCLRNLHTDGQPECWRPTFKTRITEESHSLFDRQHNGRIFWWGDNLHETLPLIKIV